MQVPEASAAVADGLMDTSSAATSAQRDLLLRFEVRRAREPGVRGAERPPTVEEFLGLDRARLAALGYALDGPTHTGERYTGELSIVLVAYVAGARVTEEEVDRLDERVAFRVLNELRLPRCDEMSVGMDRIQAEAEALRLLDA